MVQVGDARSRRRAGRLVAVGLLSALLAGCGGTVEQVEAGAPEQVVAPRPAVRSTFQGAVTAVDFEAGTMVVGVEIIWAPVLEPRSHDRQVVVDALTQWEPAPGGISQVQAGEEVQVEAEDTLDGTWRATRILLLDVD